MKPVFLTGGKHCGKSTLGKLLAELLCADFIDIDDVIAEQTGMTPRDIFTAQGEDGFKAAEFKACGAVCKALSQNNRTAVVATGGGLCDTISAVDCIRNTGLIVYLEIPEETAVKRILAKATRAPNGTLQNLPAYIASGDPQSEADVQALFHPVYVKRSELYTLFADVVFSPKNVSPEQNAQQLAQLVKSAV
jgi:shikimate kinase